MKGIVLAKKNSHAAVLAEDGLIYKVRARKCGIGDSIALEEKHTVSYRYAKLGLAIAAAFMLFIISAFSYLTPTGYVSMDVNPSLEFTLNTFDRVINVTALNHEAEMVLRSINIRNMSVAKALETTAEKMIGDGYIAENGGILVTVSMANKSQAEKMAERLRQCIQRSASEAAKVEVIVVSMDKVKEARRLGVTPGKLSLVERLEESSTKPEEIIREEWTRKSIGEIKRAIQENIAQSETEGPGNPPNNGPNSQQEPGDTNGAGENEADSQREGEQGETPASSGEPRMPDNGGRRGPTRK